MIYLKRHLSENGIIIAMCDSELIDQVLQDGVVELNLKDYSSFYKGELMTAADAKKTIDSKDIYSANVVGDESIRVAIGSSIIEKAHVRTVNKVPYAQAFKVK
jgi:hypothetical protein